MGGAFAFDDEADRGRRGRRPSAPEEAKQDFARPNRKTSTRLAVIEGAHQLVVAFRRW